MERPEAERPLIKPPEESGPVWLRSGRPVPRLLLAPLERFLRLETGSAALLMVAAVVALVWSNVAGQTYEDFWSAGVVIDVGSLHFEEDLRHVVNDLLMALFFFVVALEVKREMLHGSLRDRRTAAVPAAAALGTMAGAAVAYVAVNIDGGELRGWAIPIATDIAFAVGVLGLAGQRAPRELRAFLLTLAVVDDLATIAVIGLFFGDEIAVAWLGAALLITIAIVVCQRIGIRTLAPYAGLAGLLWVAVYESGIHPTIAGVLLGFLTPAVAFHPPQATGKTVSKQMADLARADADMSEAALWESSRLTREAVPPLARMERQLHPWSAYLVLPVFALANAGVPVSLADLGDALTGQVGLGIMLGLVVGAPIGGFLFAWALVRLSPARLQQGLDWPAVAGVAPLKGIGFTVAIFISVLAFDETELQEEAKLAILIASLLAGVIGLIALFARHRLVQQRNT